MPRCYHPPVENSAIVWIDDAATLRGVCDEAKAAGALAVDTEADSFHSYYPKVCLIQVSFAGHHALVDTLALSAAELAPLGELLAERRVLKIFHGADYDLRMLQKDFGFSVRNLKDTQAAAQVLGEPQTSLAALVKKELGVQLDKTQQRADWALRPLPPEMLRYAVDDTRYLHELLHRLEERLRATGRLSWWEEECRALEQVVYERAEADPWAFLRVKGARRLKGEALGRLAALWHWREGVAQGLNVPPFRVLSSEVVLRLAEEPPSDLAALARVPGVSPRVVRRWGSEILQAVAAARELAPPPPNGRPRPDETVERLVKKLRAARDRVAHELGIDPGFLAPRAALEALAAQRPADDEGWLECLRRRWRVSVLRQPLEQVLAEN